MPSSSSYTFSLLPLLTSLALYTLTLAQDASETIVRDSLEETPTQDAQDDEIPGTTAPAEVPVAPGTIGNRDGSPGGDSKAGAKGPDDGSFSLSEGGMIAVIVVVVIVVIVGSESPSKNPKHPRHLCFSLYSSSFLRLLTRSSAPQSHQQSYMSSPSVASGRSARASPAPPGASLAARSMHPPRTMSIAARPRVRLATAESGPQASSSTRPLRRRTAAPPLPNHAQLGMRTSRRENLIRPSRPRRLGQLRKRAKVPRRRASLRCRGRSKDLNKV